MSAGLDHADQPGSLGLAITLDRVSIEPQQPAAGAFIGVASIIPQREI
jgi:hypothetical protein